MYFLNIYENSATFCIELAAVEFGVLAVISGRRRATPSPCLKFDKFESMNYHWN